MLSNEDQDFKSLSLYYLYLACTYPITVFLVDKVFVLVLLVLFIQDMIP